MSARIATPPFPTRRFGAENTAHTSAVGSLKNHGAAIETGHIPNRCKGMHAFSTHELLFDSPVRNAVWCRSRVHNSRGMRGLNSGLV